MPDYDQGFRKARIVREHIWISEDSSFYSIRFLTTIRGPAEPTRGSFYFSGCWRCSFIFNVKATLRAHQEEWLIVESLETLFVKTLPGDLWGILMEEEPSESVLVSPLKLLLNEFAVLDSFPLKECLSPFLQVPVDVVVCFIAPHIPQSVIQCPT